MPDRFPVEQQTDHQPAGPQRDGPRPDRTTEGSPEAPILGNDDTKNPNDPPLKPELLPIGDPAGIA